MREIIYCILSLPSFLLNCISCRVYQVEHGKIKINGLIRFHGNGKISLGENVEINSAPFLGNPVGINCKTHICSYDNARLTIGNNVGISGATIVAHCGITIEDNVLIGGGTQIFDSDFHSVFYNDRLLNNVPEGKPTFIKKGAFVGGNTIILKGVTIGERSVIGAGSVVAKDVPNDEVWAGNPARFIKKIENK